jgi:2-polyprenyl-3-methyl-5-hydroxy-6-metoxy-1,4-benzoquinol methylase
MQKRHINRLQYFKEQSECVRKYVLPYILEAAPEPNPKKCRVLEVGSGEGGNLLPFARMGYDCCGVELSKKSHSDAVRFYEEIETTNKPLLVNKNIYDATESELGGKFDIVFLKDVIEHIPDQARFLQHLKQFLKSNGIVFFAFPPWRMPFGGHQQVSKSRLFSKTPYIHLIPAFVLKLIRIKQQDIDLLTEIKATSLSIHNFENILKSQGYTVVKRTHWLINPNYQIKFGLKPRRLNRLFQIRHIEDYYTTAMYYLTTLKQK